MLTDHVKKEGFVEEMPEPEVTDCKSETGLDVVNYQENPRNNMPAPGEQSTVELNSHLPPDHPLLARFQQTLKEHLLRVKSQLTEDIDEIKHKIKLKKEEREQFGVKYYDMQQEIEKQNNLLDEYSLNINNTVTKRVEEEKKCNDLRRQYEKKLAETNDRKTRYNQHVLELNHLQNLENNVRKWALEFEDELITSKRIVNKDFQQQKINAQEKQKLDLLTYNMEIEVQKREEELQGLIEQIGEQKRINNILETSVSDANADLEALQQEHKHLTQAWGEVIVAIQHRDRVLFHARESLEKNKERLKLLNTSIEATKKLRAKETEQNCKLRNFKERLECDLKNLKRDAAKQEEILAKLDEKLEELPRIIDQTDNDYKQAKKESHQLAVQLNSIQFNLDRLYAVKSRIEGAILKLAQDQLLCDKASVFRIKVLEQNQNARRNMELNLEKVGKQLSNLLVKLERQKNENLRVQQEGDTLAKTLKQRNEESDEINKELKEVRTKIALKMKLIERLSRTLDTMLKEAEGMEMTPTDYKIKSMEKAVSDTDEKVQEHQQFWLILQSHHVHLHEKRSNQLSEIQVGRKQLMIVSQKSLRTDIDIEKEEASARVIDREIQSWATKLELLSAKYFEKKKNTGVVEFDCNMEQAELANKLKDNELRVLELEEETLELQSEIESHKEEVLELHREALSWETKYKLLDDIIRWRRKESSTESEIGHMRAEIHRMQIRYKELQRAQEKLIQDLDHCVMHRETIFVNASTRQKMETTQFRARTNMQQRVHDMNTKIKHIHFEILSSEKSLNELIREHAELQKLKTKIKEQMDEDIECCKKIMNEINQAILLKHQNLATIVRKQNRAKEYRRLTSMTGSMQSRSSKSESSIELNMKKQGEINSNLIEVVEALLNDFPEKNFALLRITQTLQD